MESSNKNKTLRRKSDIVDAVLDRWLHLQKINKEEITLNEISKDFNNIK